MWQICNLKHKKKDGFKSLWFVTKEEVRNFAWKAKFEVDKLVN